MQHSIVAQGLSFKYAETQHLAKGEPSGMVQALLKYTDSFWFLRY